MGFEVSTAVVMKRYAFWYITQCIPLKVNLCVGGTASESKATTKNICSRMRTPKIGFRVEE
jgi:hypothetical protein